MVDILGWVAVGAYVSCVVVVGGVLVVIGGGICWALWSDFRDMVADTINGGHLLALGGTALLAAFALWLAVLVIIVLEICKRFAGDRYQIERELSFRRAVRWMGVCLAGVPVWPAAVFLVAWAWGDANFTAFIAIVGALIQFGAYVAVAVYIIAPLYVDMDADTDMDAIELELALETAAIELETDAIADMDAIEFELALETAV